MRPKRDDNVLGLLLLAVVVGLAMLIVTLLVGATIYWVATSPALRGDPDA